MPRQGGRDSRERRHADRLKRPEALARLGATAIDADLACAQHSLQLSMCHVRIPALEPAIETHAGLVLRHHNRLGDWFGGRGGTHPGFFVVFRDRFGHRAVRSRRSQLLPVRQPSGDLALEAPVARFIEMAPFETVGEVILSGERFGGLVVVLRSRGRSPGPSSAASAR